MITLELPFPPSVNNYYRYVGPRVLISASGRTFRRRVHTLVYARHLELAGEFKTFAGPINVEVDIHPPDNIRRDIDNIAKSLLDAMQHAGVYENDNQVARLVLTRCAVVKGGGVVVRIREWDGGGEDDGTE